MRTVVHIGFLVMLLLAAGPAAAANSGVVFEPGDRITTAIEPADETDTYVFDGVAGELLTLKLSPAKGSALVPDLTILDPDGAELDPGSTLSVKKGRITLKKLALAKSGRYALVVSASGADGGGYVLASKAKLPKKASLKNRPFAAGESIEIPFAGTSGATVKVVLKAKGGSGFTVTSVADPSGADLPGGLAALVPKGSGVRGSFPLTQGTGTYLLSVTNGAEASTFTAVIVTKFPKPRKAKTTLDSAEPRVTAIAPGLAFAGESITLTGESFDAATTVRFGDAEAASTLLSATGISAVVPAGAGTVDVTVSDAAGQANSLVNAFVYAVAAPTATVTFPPRTSETDAENLTVTGTAASPIEVAAVRVNGTAATSTDGFATWSVKVPLTLGANTITVETEDDRGTVDPAAADVSVVRTGPALSRAWWLGLDSANGRLLLAENGRPELLGMNLSTGATTLYSGPSLGTGTQLQYPQSIAYDSVGDRAFVPDIGGPSIFSVDLATGDRTVVSSNSVGTGTRFRQPEDVVYDATNSRLLVADSVLDGIVEVDLATGNRTVISSEDEGVGAGPDFGGAQGLVLDSANGRVLVAVRSAIMAVDLSTGDRSIVSNAATGTGPTFTFAFKLDLDAGGGRVFVADLTGRRIFAVELATGNRTEVVDFGRFTRDLAWDAAGNRLLAMVQERDAVASVNPATGAVTWLTDQGTGTGPDLGDALALGFSPTDDEFFLLNGTSVVAVEAATGNRRVVSDTATGTGTAFGTIYSGAWDAANRRMVVFSLQNQNVLVVDVDTGDRTVVSSVSVGTGPAFGTIRAAVVDPGGERVLAVSHDDWGLFSINLDTGDRMLVSGATRGTGPAFERAHCVDLDLANDRALLVDQSDDVLIAVDLNTGDRTVIASNSAGSGPEMVSTNGILLEAGGATALLLERPGAQINRVNLSTGDRTQIAYPFGGIGAGVPFILPQAMCVSGTVAFVANTISPSIAAVELNSGDRVFLSKE